MPTVVVTRGRKDRKKAICRDFAAGNCSYGKKCRFSHDLQSHPEGGSPNIHDSENPRPPAPPENTELVSWRRKLGEPRAKTFRPLLEGDLINLCETALTLLSLPESNTRHQVVISLANKAGLARICEVMEISFDHYTLEIAVSLFARATVPMLQVITHNEVTSSPALETSRGAIFNVMYGSQGRRAVVFYTGLISLLRQISSMELLTEQDYIVSLSAALAGLSEIIGCNRSARLLEEFHNFQVDFTQLMNPVSMKSANSLRVQDAVHHLVQIRDQLKLGTTITRELNHPALPAAFAGLEIGIDGPGRLSTQGPRHDNDHEDICNIQIMPTPEEIRSTRLDYLPTTNITKLHIGGIKGLLDRQFRLLREDTIGQLRDCVQCVFKELTTPGLEAGTSQRLGHVPRYIVYNSVVLSDVLFEMRASRDLQVVAEFEQPFPVRTMKRKEDRQQWWAETKQLHIDSLLCLVDSNGGSVFLSVSQREEVIINDSPSQGVHNVQSKTHPTGNTMGRNLWTDQQRCVITLQLVDLVSNGVGEIIGRSHSDIDSSQVLVEFPGILLPSFRPILEALQIMSSDLKVPFADMIAPSSSNAETSTPIGPPAYALQPGFAFDLRPVANNHELYLDLRKELDMNRFLQYSSLDKAQGVALVNALSRSLALIQGPPGTGKSYVAVQAVKVLLARREEAEMGPIICVCFTNHALDQFLEQVLSQATDKIIRLGAGSKSKVLDPFNLRNISPNIEATKAERTAVWKAHKNLEYAGTQITRLLQHIKRAASTAVIEEYLQVFYPHHAVELFQRPDEDNSTILEHEGQDPIPHWLHEDMHSRSGSHVRVLQELRSCQLHSMNQEERATLHKSWVTAIRESLINELSSVIKYFVACRDDLNRCRRHRDLRCLEQAHIVGLTTSGLAANADSLRRLAPKVLLCEEAGEILEAHTLAALLPSIEHAILIGDHEQLRPAIQNHNLSIENPRGRQYSLDVSLFERLISHPDSNMWTPHDTLEIQRRMDPSISRLIRSTIYPNLKDHEIVKDYPSVAGMRKRLFWLDHRVHEGQGDPSQLSFIAHWNDWEIEQLVALVTHLVGQGTDKNKDIVVLTPYMRQLQKIRNALEKRYILAIGERDLEELERQENLNRAAEYMSPETQPTNVPVVAKTDLTRRLRIATVDNFQGEEGNVVIVSLVRSNMKRNSGFLRTTNRINVLLR